MEVSQAYLVLDGPPHERLAFQFLPEEIADTVAANWAEEPVIGRSEPYVNYEHTSLRQFSFTLTFFNTGDFGPGFIVDRVRWLRSLAYPMAIGSLVGPPPVVWIVVGDLLRERCVVRSVDTRYKAPWEVLEQNAVLAGESREAARDRLSRVPTVPMMAQVDIVLSQVSWVPPVSQVVRAGQESAAQTQGADYWQSIVANSRRVGQ